MALSQPEPSHSVARVAVTFERIYSLALCLYPAVFREKYAAPMQQTFCDGLHDRTVSRRNLISITVLDLLKSLAKEHFTVLRDSITRPALVFNALVLSAISTVLALALYSIPQQVLRQGLNDPQIQLAVDLRARLESGVAPIDAVPAGSIDMARSLSPFVIVYDEQGQPLASQAHLNGKTPVPPSGVFDNVRQRGEERLSWQPILGREQGVRIAAVVERVNGAHPGFVLAGRNMREVESRIGQVQNMAGLTWIGMLGVILAGTIAFGWLVPPKSA